MFPTAIKWNDAIASCAVSRLLKYLVCVAFPLSILLVLLEDDVTDQRESLSQRRLPVEDPSYEQDNHRQGRIKPESEGHSSRIHHKGPDPNHNCSSIRAPESREIVTLNKVWQVFQPRSHPGSIILAVSAFYDDREIVGALPWLRILAVAKLPKGALFCQVWYSGQPVPFVTQAIVDSSGRGDTVAGVKYGQYQFSCALPVSFPRPTHVSVAVLQCQNSTILLPVKQPIRETRMHDFGVCVAISFGRFPMARFVEWVEFHRIVGVTEFNIYDGNIDQDMQDVFNYYQKLGVLQLHSMPPPVEDRTVKSVKLSSPASLNDCMLTNMYRYRLIAVIDFDEFLVLRNHSSLSDLIEHINSAKNLDQDWYSYTLRNAYYFDHFPEDQSQPHYLNTLRFQTRISPSRYLYAPKSLVDPRRCFSVFNHYCWIRFPGTPKNFTVDVPPGLALSHHYRRCGFGEEKCKSLSTEQTLDPSILKYKTELQNRVSSVLRDLSPNR